MEISKVTLEDGRRCAVLINLLRNGRWDLSGQDAEELVRVKLWVREVASLLAAQLDPSSKPAEAAAVPTQGFRVKAMGPLPTSKVKKSRKK